MPRTHARFSTTPTNVSWRCWRRSGAVWPTWRPAVAGSTCSMASWGHRGRSYGHRRPRRSRWAGRISPARRCPGALAVTGQLDSLAAQRESLQAEEEKLTLASQRLQAKVEAFRTRKETIKATYTAAEAQTKINEAVTGISEEMGDVGMAMQRAEDKTAQMQARSQALDGLLASGALSDATLPTGGGDDIQVALDAARGTSDVDARTRRGAPRAVGIRSRRRRSGQERSRGDDRTDSRRGSVRCRGHRPAQRDGCRSTGGGRHRRRVCVRRCPRPPPRRRARPGQARAR